eukprot:CAMPEP_0118899442 /NCGR_PEP_ID=MMETSP1166-20130328/5998_1 /TAXON_ID=1104430 /ORGANISM="Chrysoreinhardia sp, Strain CCMP3193" /LENGTH=232 /DNA_ID=CAMNT_0006838569 /DNA_START=5 /DNA_END=703 /DNA_ORIENTATION=+
MMLFALGMSVAFFSYVVAWVASSWVFPRTKCRASTADSLFGVAYYPLVVALAMDGCARLWGPSRETRWFGSSASSTALGVVLGSRMVVHVPLVFAKRFDVENRGLYVVHHAIVVLIYGTGATKAHFYGAAAALCEVTNVFLTVDELLELTHRKPSPVVRLGLAGSYVLTRLVLFPAVLVLFALDVRHLLRTHTLHDLGPFEVIAYPTAMSLVFAMSLHWAKQSAGSRNNRRR